MRAHSKSHASIWGQVPTCRQGYTAQLNAIQYQQYHMLDHEFLETVLLQPELLCIAWQIHLEQGHVDVHNLVFHPAANLHTQNVPSKHCHICPGVIDQPDVFVSRLITKSFILNRLHCSDVVHGEWSNVWLSQKASKTQKSFPQRIVHLNSDTTACAVMPKQ